MHSLIVVLCFAVASGAVMHERSHDQDSPSIHRLPSSTSDAAVSSFSSSWFLVTLSIICAASLIGLTVTSLGHGASAVGAVASEEQPGCCKRCLAALLGDHGSRSKAGGEGGVALVEAGYDSDDDAAFAAQCASFDSKRVGAAYTSAGMMTRGDVIGDEQL